MAENLWVNIAYNKQDDGKIGCLLTSNVPFERGVAFYDMKVYASGLGRVYEQFAVSKGATIHIDVYMNGGEGTGLINADFKVTEQAVEVVKSREIEATVSQDEE
jgi:hypothetical protein